MFSCHHILGRLVFRISVGDLSFATSITFCRSTSKTIPLILSKFPLIFVLSVLHVLLNSFYPVHQYVAYYFNQDSHIICFKAWSFCTSFRSCLGIVITARNTDVNMLRCKILLFPYSPIDILSFIVISLELHPKLSLRGFNKSLPNSRCHFNEHCCFSLYFHLCISRVVQFTFLSAVARGVTVNHFCIDRI